MMRQQKRHIKRLAKEIVERFGATVRYEFKGGSQNHLVEVTPREVYESEEFKDFMMAKIMEFYRVFADSSIVFMTDDSLAEISHPEFVMSSSSCDVDDVFSGCVELTDLKDWIEITKYYPVAIEPLVTVRYERPSFQRLNATPNGFDVDCILSLEDDHVFRVEKNSLLQTLRIKAPTKNPYALA